MSEVPQNATISEAELTEACDRAERALRELSDAALGARNAALASLTADLYSASNRALRMLDAIMRLHGRKT